MLIIKYPNCCINEYSYILKVIFTEFLGIEYRCIESEDEWVVIEHDCNMLKIPNVFLRKTADGWLGKETLPKQPLKVLDTRELPFEITLTDPQIPVIFGKSGWHSKGRHAQLNIDIFGSAFFMLSRYEEAVKKDRDDHDRFPATASLAYQEGFLERPIVNEYVEILWSCMKSLWPGLERKKREFRTLVSCDIDHAYQDGIKKIFCQLKHIGGDLILRKSPQMALMSTINYFASKIGNLSFDPYYSRFDWMMDINEKAGNKMAFYFMADQVDPVMDDCYSLDEPAIRSLLRRIHERGHEIGIHASYNSYKDKAQFYRETVTLKQVMKEEGINQEVQGGRQHYLRWDTSATARNWETTGMAYDSTLTFAEHAGFRCGVCYAYPLYDLQKRRMLKLKESPLIVMEKTVGEKKYMGKGYGNTFVETALHLKEIVKFYEGDFTLLWHNSSFFNNDMTTSYVEII